MQNNLPQFSVVIPVLNGAKTLKACLVSVLNQDLDSYEIIVVDNNSSDNTKEIIMDFVKKSPKVLYVFEPNLGRGNARNAGIAHARGNIIAMTDSDCVVKANWLRNLTKPILEARALAVIGFEEDAVKNYWSKIRQAEDWRFLKSKIEGSFVNHIDTKNFAISAALLKKIGFDHELFAYEDWDLFIRLKKENIKVFFLPEVLVSHYHDASAKELFKTQFSRGRGFFRIMEKYRDDKKFKELFKNDESALSIKNINFLFFIPWAFWQLISRPLLAPHLIISDFAWKLGIISAYFGR